MQTETFEFDGYHGFSLPATLWLPEHAPRCILQISHGMTEHIDRYTALAQELTEHGIIVAGFDLRGHGRNPGDPNIASFGEGWHSQHCHVAASQCSSRSAARRIHRSSICQRFTA